jgi:hypothetical protein
MTLTANACLFIAAVGTAVPPPAKAAQVGASAAAVGDSSATAGSASALSVLPPGSCNDKLPSEVLEVIVDKVIASTLTGRYQIQTTALQLVTLSEVRAASLLDGLLMLV